MFAKALIERIEGKMVAVATDETVDRHGDSLPIDSWDLKNFKRNPVLMWGHDYSLPPVGIAKNIKIEGKRMTFEPYFHDITQLAREVRAMYESEPPILRTFSVGFLPHYEKAEGDGTTRKVPLELLEISAVPIPANPSAKITEKSLKAAEIDERREEVSAWLKELGSEMPTEPEIEEDEKGSDQATSMEVQSVICDKKTFDLEEKAKTWVASNGFTADKASETDEAFAYEQFEAKECQEGSQSELSIEEGVKFLICRRPKGLIGDGIAVPKALLERIPAMSGEIRALNSELEKIKSTIASAASQEGKTVVKVEPTKGEIDALKQAEVLRRALKIVDKTIGLALKETK